MGKVISLSQAQKYLENLVGEKPTLATILDTNILITASYEIRDQYEEVIWLLGLLSRKQVRLFGTVNTRSEFLEFQRRVAITELLLDLVDDESVVRIPRAAKAQINVLKGTLKTSVQASDSRDFVFNDSHLKKIIKKFSAREYGF